ncbi:hypothetical protein [Aeromonas sp. QDB66]|uniref:hypothetical protein n=1 Tax=Aeromonas sp. QDB66 TaxID=2989824 RepID=UPI0022E2EF03|nr:hypothetical protein [Aeromonas sp. QDB66]
MKYVITSGWWCNNNELDTREKLLGDNLIREKKFFDKWYDAVKSYTNPKKILIVDSNSPIKPELPDDELLEFVSLDENAGHSTNHSGKYCGYTRAIFTGMGYAISCNVDYWVYVEQDALVYGDSIIENAISNMNDDFMFGSGKGTPQILQQSLIVMKTSFIPTFLSNYSKIKATDNKVSPEIKFAISCSNYAKVYTYLMNSRYSIANRLGLKLIKHFLRKMIDETALPFGFGRARPIDFSEKNYYFQHGTLEEIELYENNK